MIPMSCPNCGRHGDIPLDRLNSRMKCRKCGARFYMDQTGSIVLGDPNDTKSRKRKRKATDSGPAIDLDLGRMIRDMPKPVRIGTLSLVAVFGLGFGISALWGAIREPDDVVARSCYVGELFVDNNLEKLRELAAPGTADDAASWHGEMRPQLNFEGPRRARGDVVANGAVMFSGETTAQTLLSLMVSNAPPPPLPGQPVQEGPQNLLSMTLFWVEQDGKWVVDFSQTLANATIMAKPTAQPRGSGGRRQ